MGTINITRDMNTVVTTFKLIDFALETPAGICLRFGLGHQPSQGRIWKMTKSITHSTGKIDQYKTLNENNFSEGEKVQLEEV